MKEFLTFDHFTQCSFVLLYLSVLLEKLRSHLLPRRQPRQPAQITKLVEAPKFIVPVWEQCMCLFYAPPESTHLATWLPVFLLNSTRCGIVLSVLSRPVNHTGGLCRHICFPREPSPAERPMTAHGSLMGLGWAFSLTAWAFHLPSVRRSGRIRARTGSSEDLPFTVRFPRPWMSGGQVCGAVVPRSSEAWPLWSQCGRWVSCRESPSWIAYTHLMVMEAMPMWGCGGCGKVVDIDQISCLFHKSPGLVHTLYRCASSWY